MSYTKTSDTCPNCGNCPAVQEDEGYNIPQAGFQTCPVCGQTNWFVVNRCATCEPERFGCTCPEWDEPIWGPGLTLIRIKGK